MNKKKENKKENSSGIRIQKVSHTVKDVMGGNFLTRENVVKQLHFLILLVGLALVYISNSYSSEKMAIKTERIKKENEVLRYEHILMKSKLMDYSRQSEVARKLRGTGLKESLIPPTKIYTNRKK